MTTPSLALADELAAIRAEIARLRSRETALAALEHNFPKVPVFRRSPAPRGNGSPALTAAHA